MISKAVSPNLRGKTRHSANVMGEAIADTAPVSILAVDP